MIYVYKNTKNKCYSIMKNGRVVDRKKIIYLKSCEFVVRPAGRRKTITEKRKNVHAFIKGELSRPFNIKNPRLLSYDPYQYNYFFDKINKKKLEKVKYIKLDFDNKIETYGSNI